ncbi:MAG: tRNA threonylcarbamoyladenosine dehydratase [Desulfuromonadales bacterium]|nr:tRNA threonylcarbamoyladenosine dehydratase [Desulfuromonadales bacterium]
MNRDGRFDRLELLLGEAALKRLQQASVAVFGLGGVGSHAVEALVRGGVGHLTLVDFDSIDISNSNRQIHATVETIGQPKAAVMAQRCRSINPQVKVDAHQALYNAETADELLGGEYDYVLDCIDQITAKLHLIQSCLERGLPIISSMGAANKVDPTQIEMADLSKTRHCRLARIMRKELRRRGISKGVKTVYSTEEFHPLTEGRRPLEAPADGQQYQQQRAPLGSSSVIPPLFGLTMAGEVLRSLSEEKG